MEPLDPLEFLATRHGFEAATVIADSPDNAILMVVEEENGMSSSARMRPDQLKASAAGEWPHVVLASHEGGY